MAGPGNGPGRGADQSCLCGVRSPQVGWAIGPSGARTRRAGVAAFGPVEESGPRRGFNRLREPVCYPRRTATNGPSPSTAR